MLNLNRVELIGNVGKVEIKTTNSKTFATIHLATNERWTRENGEKGSRTDWHRLVTFAPAKVALIEKHVRKGDFIRLVGKLRSHSWEQDGETHYATDIEIREIGFLSSKDAGAETDEGEA